MKVTIIGGGSYQWGPTLTADLLLTESFAGSELVFQDIDPTPLPKMETLAHKIMEATGTKATVSSTTDQRAALDGADYVVVTISTGGFRSMAVDLGVPAKYGIEQSVGDSVGPGGISRALRNIPILVGIAKDMEELCPDAWMLNITNPMTTLTRSVCKETSIKAVGLCHEVGNFAMDLAVTLRLPHTAVHLGGVTGVNHFPVITAFNVEGNDGFEVIRGLVDELGGLEALAPDPNRPEVEPMSKLDWGIRNFLKLSMFDRWGVIPGAGDRHLAEFLPSILTEESGFGRDWGIALTKISTRERHQEEYIADVDAIVAGTKPPATWSSDELMARVIDSFTTGEPQVMPVNIPNTGQCPDLPMGVVVESMCIVDGDGIRGRDQAVAPPAVAEILRRTSATQELTVSAAVSGDRSLVHEAMLIDPLAGRGDIRKTEQMADELLAGTAEWLPQFA